ncbi:Hypothetical protein PHPALM_20777 [Phytophthora palmivora]|uniref:Uncharacterized protein n=1 Tax=Phytophthora palmivora TaxID=4796 RepID=A0A2P4XE07_9STRA|nr:Hypothetical protein PHPALM_20777 [Phytophthora palmivora]
MISRWGNTSVEEKLAKEDATIRVTLELQHCDPVSPWHYVGLVFVGGIGFASTVLLLCMVGEFVFGLRTITKLQKAAQQQQFVELAQIEPQLKVKSCDKESDECQDEAEETTAPLMTTVIPTDSESEKTSPA